MRVVVIGAGLGGLAAAANLVRRGHDVTGLERELVPGGRAGVFAEPGFHIDTGPTMITMPVLLRATFAAAGADVDRYVKLEPLEPMHRATFAEAGAKPRRKDQLGARRSTTRGRPQAACRSSRVPHRRRVERSFDPLDWEAMGSSAARRGR